ncbi:MAG: oligosaccharide flippase family protein [Candidatus Acidiferrum sp.]|jgi:O-antigen/teichoic acid export membrane protein
MTTVSDAQQRPGILVQTFWLAVAKCVAALFNIGIPILLVRLLSQSEYGVFKQAFLFTGTASNIAALGVSMSAFYFMPRHPEKGGEIALNILIYNFVAGLVPLAILVWYRPILKILFRTNELDSMALLLGLLALITLSGSLIQVIPTAMQDVKASTVLIIGNQLVRSIMVAATALIFRSIESLIIVSIVHQLMALAVLLWYLHRKFGNFWLRFDWRFFCEQLVYAFPYGVLGLLWVIQKDLDNYFVSAKLGPTDYAIYAVGWLEVPLISLFLESIVSVLIIRVSALQQLDRKEDIRRLIAAASTRLAAFQFPIYALLLVTGHDLIVLMYTRRYEQSTTIFAFAITLFPLTVFLMDPIGRAYRELGRFALGVRIVVFAALFAVLSPVIDHFGMVGAAMVAVGAQVVERIVLMWKTARTVDATRKDIKLSYDFFKIAGVAAAGGLCALAARNLLSPNLLVLRILVAGVCFAAVYLPTFYALRLPGWDALSPERIKTFVQARLTRLKNASA